MVVLERPSINGWMGGDKDARGAARQATRSRSATLETRRLARSRRPLTSGRGAVRNASFAIEGLILPPAGILSPGGGINLEVVRHVEGIELTPFHSQMPRLDDLQSLARKNELHAQGFLSSER